jgi:hypothetical protein
MVRAHLHAFQDITRDHASPRASLASLGFRGHLFLIASVLKIIMRIARVKCARRVCLDFRDEMIMIFTWRQ